MDFIDVRIPRKAESPRSPRGGRGWDKGYSKKAVT